MMVVVVVVMVLVMVLVVVMIIIITKHRAAATRAAMHRFCTFQWYKCKIQAEPWGRVA